MRALVKVATVRSNVTVIFPHPIVILRHPKERRSKCTMQPLRQVEGFHFFNARPDLRYDASGHIILRMDAPVLGVADGFWPEAEREELMRRWGMDGMLPANGMFSDGCLRPLLMLDSTWRRLPQVESCVIGRPVFRGLGSGWKSAYPRVNADGEDPEEGLATVEALYLALRLLGLEADAVLQNYHWKDAFIARNKPALEKFEERYPNCGK